MESDGIGQGVSFDFESLSRQGKGFKFVLPAAYRVDAGETQVNDQLLGKLKPIIVKYAKEASVRRDSPVLASAATLALCKFMVVSLLLLKRFL